MVLGPRHFHTDLYSNGNVSSVGVSGDGLMIGNSRYDVILNIDFSKVQKRGTGMACSDGSAIKILYENGTLGCTDVYDGDIPRMCLICFDVL